jgi:hypothetical protein
MVTKRGRPPIDLAKRASEWVRVRMTTAAWSQFEQAATEAGPTLSGWIRECLSKRAAKAPKKR